MSIKRVQVGNIDCSAKQLFLISGPCVIEEESLMMRTAERLKQIALDFDHRRRGLELFASIRVKLVALLCSRKRITIG